MASSDLTPTKIYLETAGHSHQLRVMMSNCRRGYMVVEKVRIPLSDPSRHVPELRAKARKFARANGIEFEDKTLGVY